MANVIVLDYSLDCFNGIYTGYFGKSRAVRKPMELLRWVFSA
jgi:pyridoxal/pyridoxine/pyridoxamine kinase